MMLYGQWLRLPIATRHAIALAFHINKKNPTHVVDNVVRDDGYPIGDVENALTPQAIANYLGIPVGNTEAMWEQLVAKAEGRVAAFVPVLKLKEEDIAEPDVRVEAPPSRRGRPKKVTK